MSIPIGYNDVITYCQVTCEYRMVSGSCIPIRVHTVVISVQHSEDICVEEIRKQLMTHVCVHIEIYYHSICYMNHTLCNLLTHSLTQSHINSLTHSLT